MRRLDEDLEQWEDSRYPEPGTEALKPAVREQVRMFYPDFQKFAQAMWQEELLEVTDRVRVDSMVAVLDQIDLNQAMGLSHFMFRVVTLYATYRYAKRMEFPLPVKGESNYDFAVRARKIYLV